MFKAYYNKNRFPFLNEKNGKTNLFKHVGGEVLRKTAILTSDKFNVFVDSSDGINEDLPINEYCGRIKVIVKNFNKPFLYFKCNHSKERSADIEKIAKDNRGKVLPFFIWNLHSQNPKFYTEVLPNRSYWIEKNKNTEIKYDIMYAAAEKVYDYPKPNLFDSQVAWTDHKNFGIGSPEDTGWFEMHTRANICKHLESLKNVSFKRLDKMDYMTYMNETLKFKTQFSPPGVSEYTCRLFDSAAIGQCAILRKNSYDFYDSWKSYLPEVDIKNSNVENNIIKIIEDYKTWGAKALFYFENSLTSKRIFEVFNLEIEKFKGEI